MKKFWSGEVPERCQRCESPLVAEFIDGATSFGWAMLCKACHAKYGYGLGVGRGQHYTKQDDGKWLKTVEKPIPKPKKIYTIRSDEINFP